MKKLLPLILCALFLSNFTQTFASATPTSPGHDESFNNTKWAMELVLAATDKIKGITVTENDLAPRIIAKLFMESDWTPKLLNGCAARIPNSFNPNPSYNQLLDIEALGISKIDVKIYNNWGIQVAESTLSKRIVGENYRNSTSKKLSLQQNEIIFNHEMKEGTYYYVLDICCFNGEKTVKEGEIRLMKSQKK